MKHLNNEKILKLLLLQKKENISFFLENFICYILVSICCSPVNVDLVVYRIVVEKKLEEILIVVSNVLCVVEIWVEVPKKE